MPENSTWEAGAPSSEAERSGYEVEAPGSKAECPTSGAGPPTLEVGALGPHPIFPDIEEVEHISTLTEYCATINIPAPRYRFFDIRRFEDNMKTVHAHQEPFRHEFYAIALRRQGSNTEVMGQPLTTSFFFNSPYQIISWDILPDWEGWYIMFTSEFISQNPHWKKFIVDYSFFRLDRYIAFDLSPEAEAEAQHCFDRIHKEYHSDHPDKFAFIHAYTQLLLNLTRRQFEQIDAGTGFEESNRTQDVLLVSRFRTLVETILVKEEFDPEVRHTSFYADQLAIHPNHLNAVVKRITHQTASQLIQTSLLASAKALLRQSDLSVKKIAFRLHYPEPTHFNAFFKRKTGLTPNQFRAQELV